MDKVYLLLQYEEEDSHEPGKLKVMAFSKPELRKNFVRVCGLTLATDIDLDVAEGLYDKAAMSWVDLVKVETVVTPLETLTPHEQIHPVLNEHEIPAGTTCQEASPLSCNRYIACGKPAVAIVYHDKDRRSYYMCIECADHNVRNRGGGLRYIMPAYADLI